MNASPSPRRHWFRSGLLPGLLLLLLTGTTAATAAGNFVVDTFDSNIIKWYGMVGALNFDAAENNTPNFGGSLQVSADFGSGQSLIFIGTYGPGETWGPDHTLLNLSQYGSLDFDIKWDANSTMSLADFNHPPTGGYSAFNLSSLMPGWTGWSDIFGSFVIPDAATNGWAHVSIPINHSASNIDPSQGLRFDKWIQNGGGTAMFWLDNVVLVCSNCGVPPPFLWLQPAVPGLNLFANGTYAYQRNNIRTAPGIGSLSWVGNKAASYSFTVRRFNASSANFQLHLFLVPNADSSPFPDWSDPDVLEALLLRQPDGSAAWRVLAKTNSSNMMPATVYGQITNASLVGTWTLKFNDDTNLTLVAPNSNGVPFTLPVELAARFADPLSVYFGVMPNDSASADPSVVLSRVQISGPLITTVQDDFSTGLDTNVWQVKADYPPGVQPVPSNAWRLMWTTPDTGYLLATNANPANPGGWGTNQLPAAVQLGALKYALLTTNPNFAPRPIALPADGSLFFRMQKP
ncbi:MAG TPA: hypothetical protein VMB80_11570 [Candidatus Acidoferrum sp.]|nr:hypothetical protein [Candidatus Acidoferrum sp.]